VRKRRRSFRKAGTKKFIKKLTSIDFGEEDGDSVVLAY